jgi:Fur family ferric uptake transcriptional regulator
MAQTFALGEVEVALTPQARFEEFLQSRGKRITQQRRLIVEQVFSSHDHFDADGLLGDLKRDGRAKNVSRPTVYRTLSELVDAGLLRTMMLNGRAVYEHDYGYPEHDHLHCQKCDKLIEFHSDELRPLRDAVAREYEFRVLGHRLIIEGICAECARPKRATRRLDLI